MISNYGSNQSAQTKKLMPSDMETVQENVPEIQKIVPYTNLYQSLSFQNLQFNGQIIGADQSLADIVKITMAEGRFVSFLDQNSYYCVVGHDIAMQMREKGIDPINQQITVGNQLLTIIGVADQWEPNLFLFANINQGIIIPIYLSFLINPQTQIQNVLVQLKPATPLDTAKSHIEKVITQLAPGNQVRFHDPQEIIDVVSKQRSTFTWLLSAIGGISLLVGGIGVMNIMLVSVIERRREIGIRMAIGARRKDILEMFLIESIVLTILGGLLGVFFGTITTLILAYSSGWEYHFHFSPVALGFVVSAIVGVFSGFYPSLRAAKLDPIACLQSE
ncbi:MAG: ABC transporter permease [Proteobacteria bacterium]|nr:ABC transporter permease [Pseudomonadota bacterium]